MKIYAIYYDNGQQYNDQDSGLYEDHAYSDPDVADLICNNLNVNTYAPMSYELFKSRNYNNNLTYAEYRKNYDNSYKNYGHNTYWVEEIQVY